VSRIILHIGTHKTATTSIQKFLFQHRDTLQSRGVYYPDYSLVGRDPHYAQLGMVNALSGQHKSYSVDLAKRFFNAALERSQDFDVTIISAEPFYRHVLPHPDGLRVYEPQEYWPLRYGYVESLTDVFGDAEIAIVFREQRKFAQSMYQEHVKATRYNKSFEKFLEQKWFLFDYLAQAECWKSVFPKCHTFGFAGLRAQDDVVHDFLGNLGVDVSDLALPDRANEGLPVDLVIYKRLMQKQAGPIEDYRDEMAKLKSALPDELWAQLEGRSFFGSARAEANFQSQFDTDNAVLQKTTIGAIAEPDAVHIKPIYGDRLHAALLENLLNEFIRLTEE